MSTLVDKTQPSESYLAHVGRGLDQVNDKLSTVYSVVELVSAAATIAWIAMQLSGEQNDCLETVLGGCAITGTGISVLRFATCSERTLSGRFLWKAGDNDLYQEKSSNMARTQHIAEMVARAACFAFALHQVGAIDLSQQESMWLQASIISGFSVATILAVIEASNDSLSFKAVDEGDTTRFRTHLGTTAEFAGLLALPNDLGIFGGPPAFKLVLASVALVANVLNLWSSGHQKATPTSGGEVTAENVDATRAALAQYESLVEVIQVTAVF